MRRLAPAVTAAALLAALTTGCSSTDPAPAEDGRPAAEHTTEPAGAVLTEAQLKAALVTPADAKGYTAEDDTAPPVRPKADRPRCAPLADMTATDMTRSPEAAAMAGRGYGSSAAPGLAVSIALFSYEGQGAQQTLDNARKAVADCAGGFSTSGNNGGATIAYSSVKAEEHPEGGDGSVSWVMTAEAEGSEVPMRYTVVREDSTVAVFLAIHLADPAKAKLPQDLFDRQVAKLAKHAGRGAAS
ncbi:hypothetical protein ACWDZ4_06455 [Streptomyces sp. NPDC003016]